MDALVTTQWLSEALGDDDLVVLDASAHLPDAQRDARAEFAAAHIPGAKFLDLTSFIDPDSPVPAAVPTKAQAAQRLASLGIGPSTRVVIYDDSAVKTSARAWFILRLHGYHAVAILDGGLGKWRDDGRPLEAGEPASSAETPAFDNAPTASNVAGGTGILASKADMLANLDTRERQVVDARGAARFTGEEGDFRPNVASGHIPGSRNLPFGQVLNANGTFKDAEGIRTAFAYAGIDTNQPLATTCGGGVTAAVLLFALHLIGQDDVALYDGSWSEWGVDPATPKATGAAA